MSKETAKAPLRRGWTTGACATAAAQAAYGALMGHGFADPVTISLPSGQRVAFALASERLNGTSATAGVIKDAGDDPDVTHGALVCATVCHGPRGAGIRFFAGEGVGTVTKAGLPIAVGEPAINPVPRSMIIQALQEVSGTACDVDVTISIAHGAELAKRTLNGRLGIVGGLSVLGTTGIVIPYSCAAWIASIHRGIDVARAMGLTHLAAATGNTSEKAVQALFDLPEEALIDMGDFAGGMLKYLRRHPVKRLTLAGGMGKITKLAQGMTDLHSKRGAVDLVFLAAEAEKVGLQPAIAAAIRAGNTAMEAFEIAKDSSLASHICTLGWHTAASPLCGTGTELEVVMFDREGLLIGRSGLMNVP